jgi:alanine dehydrogenase
MREAIDVVELAFREKGYGTFQMPSKTYLFFPKSEGDLRIMPAYYEKEDVAGVKIVNSHKNNPTLCGLPTVIATIILINSQTGAPLCIMDGTWITTMRTGAAGGVAAKCLARKDAETVGIVGAGVQAYTQLEALREVLPNIRRVKIVDIHPEKCAQFTSTVTTLFPISVRTVNSINEAVQDVDVIITVTPSTEPLVMDNWISNGCHINAIGADAPGKQELDPRILQRAKIVVDDWEQSLHGGEINVPIRNREISKGDIHAELSEVLLGHKGSRESSEEITIFDSTGLAIQDIATAWYIYKKAEKKGVGSSMTYF